jgi:hypothetical protein
VNIEDYVGNKYKVQNGSLEVNVVLIEEEMQSIVMVGLTDEEFTEITNHYCGDSS